MTDKIIVASVLGEDMIFRTEMKKLERGDEIIVSVNGKKELAIFIRYIDKCEEYIEDIAFQKIDETLYENTKAKESERLKKVFKDKCMKNYKPIINMEVDYYLRECGFNCEGRKFLKNIDNSQILIYRDCNKDILTVSKGLTLTKTDITNKNLITIIKIINNSLSVVR
ncbi:hypothetical protein IC213_18475 [Clostridioides sp. ES-S-0049-02]|uniref:hypothetical protein n=1 Tax=unclassified Clostridioides TaxID=2635829 RepID=UPI001D0CDD1B|nr:hypothetical protein [Clostridioides sp. ES-S-0049-02]MCC0764750.1 hypothetical protein [Clostridioides sp. ES-S-0006-03]